MCLQWGTQRRNGAQKQNQTKQENMQQPWDDYVFRSLVYFYIEYFEHLTCGNLYQGTGAVYWIETCGLIHYCNGPTVKPSKSCQHEWLMWWAGHTWQYTRFGLEWKLYNSTTLTTPANTNGPDRAHWGRNVSCVTENLPFLTHTLCILHWIYKWLLFITISHLLLFSPFIQVPLPALQSGGYTTVWASTEFYSNLPWILINTIVTELCNQSLYRLTWWWSVI